jgi:peptide/nickel transport system substrate-binding protein
MTVSFFSRTDDLAQAWYSGAIDVAAALSPESYTRPLGYTLQRGTFPRLFAVFFNQDHNTVLRDKAIRTALNKTIDKQALIDGALSGYATVIDSPVIATGMRAEQTPKPDIEGAAALLAKDGWDRNETSGLWEKDGAHISFALATANVPELKRVADVVANDWRTFGIDVTVTVFEPGDLQQTIIRPRDYDALLFGEAVGREPDLYAFWHSSQREDPGLNVALYTNKRVDEYLSAARATTDPKQRAALFKKFETEIKDDVPAVFLYTPDLLYGVTDGVYGVTLGTVSTQSERFGNIQEWYRHTERVWEFLSR